MWLLKTFGQAVLVVGFFLIVVWALALGCVGFHDVQACGF